MTKVINAIINNPYRVLGVYANASLREITANKTKMIRYSSVGKSISFDADMNGILPKVNRTTESVEKAFADLSLPQDKLKHALFWFAKDTAIDETALKQLDAGNTEKAIEILEKEETWSSLLNLGVIALARNEIEKSVESMSNLIHEENYRNLFVASVCGDSFKMIEDDLAHLFIDLLMEENDPTVLLEIFEQNGVAAEDDAYIRKKLTEAPVEKLNAEINKAKAVKEDGVAIYEAGVTLQRNAQPLFDQLESMLGVNSVEYKLLIDKVANSVLQCCIDSFKVLQKDMEDGKVDRFKEYSFKVKELLASIDLNMVSELTKARIESNLNTVSEIVGDLDRYLVINSPICYFCGKNMANPSAQFKKKMYLETGRGPALFDSSFKFNSMGIPNFNRTRIYYKQVEIGINRCEHCEKIHEKDSDVYYCPKFDISDHHAILWISIAVFVIIFGILTKSLIAGVVLGWLPGTIVTFLIGAVVDLVYKIKHKSAVRQREQLQVKRVWDVRDHPVVKKYLSEGWSEYEPY